MTEILFYHLQRQPIERVLPGMLEKSLERGWRVIVHPECRYDVVQKADEVGSTEKIIRTIEESPAGSKWAIGTELVAAAEGGGLAAHPELRERLDVLLRQGETEVRE